MTVSQKSCYSGRLFRRCKQPSVGACQYCSRSFCDQHGDLLEENQQVCRRQTCQNKVADLKAHKAYLGLIAERNGENSCGVPGCDDERWGQCSNCKGVFCGSHLHRRSRTAVHDGRSAQEPVSLCDHCWRRMNLWTRV